MSTDKFGHFSLIHGAQFAHYSRSRRLALKRKSSLFAADHSETKHPTLTEPALESRFAQITNKEIQLQGKLEELEKTIKDDFVTKTKLESLNSNLKQLIGTKAKILDLDSIKSDVDTLQKNITPIENELKNLEEKIKKAPADVISHIGIEVGPNQIKFKHKALREIKNATNESDAINLWQFRKLTEDIRPQLQSHKLELDNHKLLLSRTLVSHVSNLKRLLANGRQISNLAPPESGQDAINLDYLRVFVRSSIKDLDNKIKVLLSEKADKKNE
jgi:hypothetical protein